MCLLYPSKEWGRASFLLNCERVLLHMYKPLVKIPPELLYLKFEDQLTSMYANSAMAWKKAVPQLPLDKLSFRP